MPEGDTIFRAAKTLNLALAGKPVTQFETVLPKLARVHEDHPVTGRRVDAVSSRGKHLLIEFSGGLVLRTHMRMNGSWHLYRPGERWRRPRNDMRVVVGTSDYVAVGFNIPVAEFIESASLPRHQELARLGPDLLSDDFDLEDAVARIRSHADQPIAEVLLNQRAISGIGNIYKSEALFLSGIHPFSRTANLSDQELGRIISAARKLMRIAASAAGRRPFELGVYRRKGKPCRKCGTPIEKRKQGLDARSTYWCPRCQPAR